jgi:lipopolysaccharide transport system ATP-binding protein
MSIIEVTNVTKEYKLGQFNSLKHTMLNALERLRGRSVEKLKPFKALDNVSFKVEQGEVVGIIGQNGAGKSTLLKILARISTPTRGDIKVRGAVAPLIEVSAGLLGDLTGRENIFLNGVILGLSRDEITRKFDEIVAFAELEEFIDTPVKRYSSGMAVRLGFAIATSVGSDILIVDEVLAVGDLAFQRKCFDRMEDMIKRQGKTVLLVSHNIRQVERLCSRVILLDQGRVIATGQASSICNLFYERSDRRIIEQKASAGKTNLKTTGEIDLLGVCFLDKEAQRTSQIEYNSRATLLIRIKANRPIINPAFFVGFHTTDFVYLTTASSPESLRQCTLPIGIHELSIIIDGFPLLPGTYSTRISIDVENPIKNILYGENLCHFSVISNTLQRTSPVCAGGFFHIETSWQLRNDPGRPNSLFRLESQANQ